MIRATVSADIVRSTSLDEKSIILMQEHLHEYLAVIEKHFPGCWGRVVRGDCLECVLDNAKLALRLALMLKCHVKAFNMKTDMYVNARFGPRFFFNRYGVRISIGFGDLRTNDRTHGIIDGPAIYNSGRSLDSMSTRMRTNIVVSGGESTIIRMVQTIAALCDIILTRASSRQCEVLYLRMLGMREQEIANKICVTQVAVNALLRRAGWYALEEAIDTFEEVI